MGVQVVCFLHNDFISKDFFPFFNKLAMCGPSLFSFTKALPPLSGNNLWFGSAFISFKEIQIFFS